MFSTRSDTNKAVQPQKKARGLKFRIQDIEGLYYLCSENKGADQLCGYCTADLHLNFSICKSRLSHDVAQIISYQSIQMGTLLVLERLTSWIYSSALSYCAKYPVEYIKYYHTSHQFPMLKRHRPKGENSYYYTTRYIVSNDIFFYYVTSLHRLRMYLN